MGTEAAEDVTRTLSARFSKDFQHQRALSNSPSELVGRDHNVGSDENFSDAQITRFWCTLRSRGRRSHEQGTTIRNAITWDSDDSGPAPLIAMQGITIPAMVGNPQLGGRRNRRQTLRRCQLANTAPTVTFAAPTSPVDGSATQTLTGTFSDDQGNDTATVTIAASLGTLGAVTKDDAAGTWEAEYTAPASTASEQTDTVTVTATDDGSLTDTASQNVTIRVTDLMPSLPPIFSQSATVGTAFSLTFSAATGGDPPLTYALSGNPAWLTLSGFTLSGTPDATGTHQVRVTVEDDDGDTAFRQFALTVSAAVDLMPSLPAIDDQTATVGTAFSLTFDAATSGDTPLSYSVSGNPAWLTLSTRTLSGTPTGTGTHTVTVTVTDDDGDTDTSSFTLTVSAAAVLLTLADFDVPSGHEEVDAALITSGLDNERLALQHRP